MSLRAEVWVDHSAMVIDMNKTKLDTIGQVREFLQGTADVAFCIPTDQSTLRSFVAAVITRLR